MLEYAIISIFAIRAEFAKNTSIPKTRKTAVIKAIWYYAKGPRKRALF